MSGLFQITVTEARGFVAIPADLDKLAVVMGCSSAGSGFSSFYLSGSAAVAGVGYGDAVDTLCQIIEQRQANGNSGNKFPAALYTVPGSTVGSYGTIDNSLVTGTALFAVDSSVHPYLTAEARIRWVTGCTVGVTGGTYQWSLDGGRTYSNTIALGVADYITIPNSNVKVILTPSTASLTALYTKVTLLQTTMTGTGHFVLTTSSTHLAADTTDDTALAAVAAATTPPTAVTLFNACKTYLAAHGANLTYHTIADAALATALAVIPTATSVADVDLGLDDLIAAYNAHRILTTGTVHGAADVTNTITAYVSAPGTLIAGDLAKVRTYAPAPSTSDVDTAFTALALAPGDFALLVCEFPCDATMLAHITTGLNTLLSAGKRVTAICRTRIPDAETSETDAVWNASVAAVFLSSDDSRIHLRATYDLVTDAMTTRQYLRSDLAQFAADTVRVDRYVWPCAPSDQATPNVMLSDSSGTLVGHDEGPRGSSTGLSNDALGNRFGTQQRLPDPLRRESVFNCVPWVLYAAGEKIRNIMTRRVANAMERQAVSAGTASLGGVLFYTPADPAIPGSLPTLTDASRNALHGVIFTALSSAFADDIQNADDGDIDAGLVQITPTVTVSGGNLLTVAVTLAPLVLGYLLRLSVTLSVQE